MVGGLFCLLLYLYRERSSRDFLIASFVLDQSKFFLKTEIILTPETTLKFTILNRVIAYFVHS